MSFLFKFSFLTILASFLKPIWTHTGHFPSHLRIPVFQSLFIDFWAPPVRICQEVGGRAGTPLNRINSTLSLSLCFKNNTRAYTNSLKGFFWKPAAGFKGVPPLPPTSINGTPGGTQKSIKKRWKTAMHKWDGKWPICVQTGLKSGAKSVKKHNLNKKGRHRFRLLFATLWWHLASQERPKSRQDLLKKTDKKTTSLLLSARWQMT